jgi:hypothetical protein
VPARTEHEPNDVAPTSGKYELLNVFGTATGETVSVDAGEHLPGAPFGHGWRLVATDEPLEVARRRIREAEKRIARQESLIQHMERKGHAEIAKLGRTLLRAYQASLRAAHDYVERLEQLPH